MTVPLSAEQRALVSELETIAESEFAEAAFTWRGDPPWENLELLAEYGFLGVNYPEAYGGEGLSEFEALLTIETVGRVCPDTAQYVLNQQLIGPRNVLHFGSEAAKERYLPPILAGEEMLSIAISEPGAGSDVKAMTTEVREEGDSLVLDGEKTWVGYVHEASAAVVWAKFPEGIGTVLVDLDDPGVTVAEDFENIAGHTQSHLFFDNVKIPDDQVLVRGEDGFTELLRALNWERLGTAAYTNAMATAAADLALDYAATREQFGQPIGDFQGIEWKLADMAKQIEVSRSMTYRSASAAAARDGVPAPYQTSIAKLYSAEMVERVVSEALQIHGANGYMEEMPISYLYKLARGRRIGAGTDEIMKNTVAGFLQRDGIPGLAE